MENVHQTLCSRCYSTNNSVMSPSSSSKIFEILLWLDQVTSFSTFTLSVRDNKSVGKILLSYKFDRQRRSFTVRLCIISPVFLYLDSPIWTHQKKKKKIQIVLPTSYLPSQLPDSKHFDNLKCTQNATYQELTPIYTYRHNLRMSLAKSSQRTMETGYPSY